MANKTTPQLKQYLHNPIFAQLILFCFLTSCNGQIKTQTKAPMVNTTTNAVEQSKMFRTEGTGYTQVGCGFRDKVGNLWFGTLNEGVYRYDGKSFYQFTHKDGLNDNAVNAIIEDKAGNILFGTDRGITKYDGKSFTNFTDNKDINNNSIQCLLNDNAGNIWIGTMNSGVYRYDGKSFTNFLNNDSNTFHLGVHTQSIVDMIQDKKGNIWLSSFNGGGVWQSDGKSFKEFLPSKEYYQSNEDERNININPIKTSYDTSQDNISDDMISSLTEDKEGNIWFATRRHGACRYDGKSFTSFREKEGFLSYGIHSVYKDKKGNIWLCTEKNGVWCYDGISFKNFTEKDGLINNSVWFVIEDKNGNLWCGTRGFGLSRYDGKVFTTFSDYKE
ncbi:MAG TPA: two-component regulator propeller domain-containing protein [Saprospiraceae bacterium]|nr:two-component regulator propeller domain-containing protein [Saprospiraceae bacterium]